MVLASVLRWEEIELEKSGVFMDCKIALHHVRKRGHILTWLSKNRPGLAASCEDILSHLVTATGAQAGLS